MFAAASVMVSAAFLSAAPPGFTVVCANAICEMNASSAPRAPAALPGHVYCIRGDGIPGPYTMARSQHIVGACGGDGHSRPKIYGDVHIVSPGATLENVDVVGAVIVHGLDCSKTTVSNVHTRGNLIFRPDTFASSINVNNSVVSGVTTSDPLTLEYPVAFAAASGTVILNCLASTTAIVQAGRPGGTPVTVLPGARCRPVIDTGALLGVFGSAIERVVEQVPLTDDETAAQKMLASLVVILGSATAFQLLLLA